MVKKTKTKTLLGPNLLRNTQNLDVISSWKSVKIYINILFGVKIFASFYNMVRCFIHHVDVWLYLTINIISVNSF